MRMRLAFLAIGLMTLAACTSTRDGPADFTGFSAGLSGASLAPDTCRPGLPR
jgi:hypothetical protein